MSVTRTPRPLPPIFVDASVVNQRIKNFENNKRSELSRAIGHEETRSVWYSLAHFEQILKEMYYLNADGVRAYFATYEDTHAKYPGQLCLIFIPTCFNADSGKHRDIIYEQEPNFSLRSVTEAYVDEESLKNLNFGSLCKPDCDNHELYYPNDDI